jgi:hypothetical protein
MRDFCSGAYTVRQFSEPGTRRASLGRGALSGSSFYRKLRRSTGRAKASGIKPVRLLHHILNFFSISRRRTCTPCKAAISAANCAATGAAACRARARSSSTRGGWEVVETHAKLAAFYLRLHRIRRRVERDVSPYSDPALLPARRRGSATARQKGRDCWRAA